MRSLYDTNCLIAILDDDHTAHALASAWFAANIEQGWASCPLTQNGCIRILSQPTYPGAFSIAEAVAGLRNAISSEHHQFIPDDVSLLDDALVDAGRLLGHRQLTDAYLLALAVAHDARLVTLDTRIPVDAVRGANESHLVVI